MYKYIGSVALKVSYRSAPLMSTNEQMQKRHWWSLLVDAISTSSEIVPVSNTYWLTLFMLTRD